MSGPNQDALRYLWIQESVPVPCSDDTQVSVPTYSCEDSSNCSCTLPSGSPSGTPEKKKQFRACPPDYCELKQYMTQKNCLSLVQNWDIF